MDFFFICFLFFSIDEDGVPLEPAKNSSSWKTISSFVIFLVGVAGFCFLLLIPVFIEDKDRENWGLGWILFFAGPYSFVGLFGFLCAFLGHSKSTTVFAKLTVCCWIAPLVLFVGLFLLGEAGVL